MAEAVVAVLLFSTYTKSTIRMKNYYAYLIHIYTQPVYSTQAVYYIDKWQSEVV